MAALALTMEDLAMKFDAEMMLLQSGLQAGLNRPTGIWQTTADNTCAVNCTFIGFGNWSQVFANYPRSQNGAAGAPAPPIHTPGWYRFGMYGRVVQAAAVVAGSQRNGAIRFEPVMGPGTGFGFSSDIYQGSTVESNTGGENLLIQGTAEFPDLPINSITGTADLNMIVYFNAVLSGGGAVALQAGATAWLTYLGTGDQVTVVTA
jgi:hypothetical protein